MNQQLNLAVTWNTTDTMTALEVDLTDTASAADSSLMDLRKNGSSVFAARKDGEVLSCGERTIWAQRSIRNYFWGPSGNKTATGGANTGIGYNCFPALTTATNNVAIGDQAGSVHQSGTGSVWIGSAAGRLSVSCIDVVHIGYQTGEKQVAGVGDVGIGRRAIQNAGYAANNTCIGDSTGWSLNPIPVDPLNLSLGYTQGYSNVIIGYVCAEANVSGFSNVLIGAGVNSHATSGNQNVVIGAQAMQTNTGAGGDGNTGIGFKALRDYTGGDATVIGNYGFFQASGVHNTGIGASVGSAVLTGANNTFLGWGVGSNPGVMPTSITNAIGIGYNVQPTADNQVMIGNSTNDTFVFGGVSFSHADLLALKALI